MPSFGLYARVHTAHSLRRGQWMGSGYPRLHSFTKGERKTSHSMHFPYNPKNKILQVLFFGIAPNLLTLHAPQWNNPSK